MSAKNRKQQSSNISVNVKDKWEQILTDIDKAEVPIHVLDKLTIKLISGGKIHIPIGKLIADGNDPSHLEEQVRCKLHDLEHDIDDVFFYVDVDLVVSTVQPATDLLLDKIA